MIRILKNMRNKMVDVGLLEKGVAPSYFLEGLLYNVPETKFSGSYADTFVNAINWIDGADRSEFVCANERHHLLQGGSSVVWTNAACDEFRRAAIELWNGW